MSNLSALAADSMEGRRAGTTGGKRAQVFLVSEFARIGLQPAVPGFGAAFASMSRIPEKRTPIAGCPTRRGLPVPRGMEAVCADDIKPSYPVVIGKNLLGLVRGTAYPERFIVLSAHYDHVGRIDGRIYNGADDNASGSAAILSIAEWFVAHPPVNSILFAWFDAEEAGLLGSDAFVKDPAIPLAQIVVDVNVDMISRSERSELFAVGAARYPFMQPFIDSIRTTARVTVKQGHDVDAGREDWTNRSDMGPFSAVRIPFVHFGVEEHADYHKPSDRFERINPAFYYRSALTVADFVGRLDRGLNVVVKARTAP